MWPDRFPYLQAFVWLIRQVAYEPKTPIIPMLSLLSLQNICFNYSSSKFIFYPLRGVQNENRKSSSLKEQQFVNRKEGPPIAGLDISLKKKSMFLMQSSKLRLQNFCQIVPFKQYQNFIIKQPYKQKNSTEFSLDKQSLAFSAYSNNKAIPKQAYIGPEGSRSSRLTPTEPSSLSPSLATNLPVL